MCLGAIFKEGTIFREKAVRWFERTAVSNGLCGILRGVTSPGLKSSTWSQISSGILKFNLMTNLTINLIFLNRWYKCKSTLNCHFGNYRSVHH